MDDVSVIIRTKNEERWIGHAIQSVIDLLNKPEIIIVENHSSDSTLDIIKSFKQDPMLNNDEESQYTSLEIVQIDDYTPGRSISFGVQKSSKNYILILSSHCVLTKINFEKHIKALETYCSVYGNQDPLWRGKRITKRYIWDNFKDEEIVNYYSEYESRYFLHNALAMYKKSTLEKYPFDENLIGKEDRYWANMMIKNGSSILYDPSLSALHHYTNNGNTWKGLG